MIEEYQLQQLIGLIGVEIWRLGLRIESGKVERLPDSYQRLSALFEELGGRIEDRQGETFIDGMNAEILVQPDGIDPGSGALVWDATVRPGIYINDHCVVTPQVILSSRQEKGTDEATATHD